MCAGFLGWPTIRTQASSFVSCESQKTHSRGRNEAAKRPRETQRSVQGATRREKRRHTTRNNTNEESGEKENTTTHTNQHIRATNEQTKRTNDTTPTGEIKQLKRLTRKKQAQEAEEELRTPSLPPCPCVSSFAVPLLYLQLFCLSFVYTRYLHRLVYFFTTR